MADDPEVGEQLEAAGYSTNVLRQGGDGRPLLLLHGSGPGASAWSNWWTVIPMLDGPFIAPDLLGFGHTEPPADGVYTLDRWIDHALGVLDALGVDEVDVAANSFGGTVALGLAARHPNRVRRMVLVSPLGTRFDLTPGLDEVWGYQPSLQAMIDLIRLFTYQPPTEIEELADLRFRISQRTQQAFESMFPAPRQVAIDVLSHPDEVLESINQPILIAHGRQDPIVPLEASLRLVDLLPNARVQVYGRCGHWAQGEHAEEFFRELTGFLAVDEQSLQ